MRTDRTFSQHRKHIIYNKFGIISPTMCMETLGLAGH